MTFQSIWGIASIVVLSKFNYKSQKHNRFTNSMATLLSHFHSQSKLIYAVHANGIHVDIQVFFSSFSA